MSPTELNKRSREVSFSSARVDFSRFLLGVKPVGEWVGSLFSSNSCNDGYVSISLVRERELQSQSKWLGHFGVSLSPQCWCTRFGDQTAINNFERDEGSTRREKTAFSLSVPTIFV